MASSKTLALFSLALASFNGAQAALNLDSTNNIAVYWGQNSFGQSTGPYVQQRLAYYCQNTEADVYQVSFLTRFNGVGGVPEVNFANAGDNCTAFPGTQLLDCPQIAEDIKICQSLGRTILLSIGGATYNEGGFTSEAAAKDAAKLVWETFGPVTNSSAKRPFGDAVIDGFDLDFEAVVNNMPAFANQLRAYYNTDPSKKYYTTAAPQCPYPDAAGGPMLAGTVYFDAIWIQFYNNYCGLQAYVPGSTTQNNFNFDVWDKWARETSLNKNAKVFLGVPGNQGAAGTGYEPISTVAEIIKYVKQFSSFGGAMVWDASQVYANSGFLSGLRSAVGGGAGGTPNPPTTTTTTTSTTKPTTIITTTKPTTTTTTTASNPKPTGGVCPVAGQTCPTSGASACNGSQIGICDNGKWVLQQCPAGLVCANDGTSVYCNYPGSTGTSTGPCA
ncbi:glycoside hydrolase superfamily [Aspergillus bertholletiae]|uniref:chitinase n=1 Tax=Aspergillus bertholletiae TaxID=1226010 RepID=A0A5N7B575_9EURO|nr:glycoside hydrolase superfamily [Aspergillus bertholletiae]